VEKHVNAVGVQLDLRRAAGVLDEDVVDHQPVRRVVDDRHRVVGVADGEGGRGLGVLDVRVAVGAVGGELDVTRVHVGDVVHVHVAVGVDGRVGDRVVAVGVVGSVDADVDRRLDGAVGADHQGGARPVEDDDVGAPVDEPVVVLVVGRNAGGGGVCG